MHTGTYYIGELGLGVRVLAYFPLRVTVHFPVCMGACMHEAFSSIHAFTHGMHTYVHAYMEMHRYIV